MSFSTLALRAEIVSALTKLGYHEPTAVQSQVIPLALDGKNIVVQSHTGSGKTAAFVIPALNTIEVKTRKPQVLILEPTRELAMQTRDEVFNISRDMRMGSMAVFGGSPIRRQIEGLKAGPQVIIATPGRLMDLIERRSIDISSIETLVIDEVDQMMDMGFSAAVIDIWERIPTIKQVMTFSATYTKEITNMLNTHIKGGYESLILSQTPTVDTIDHVFMRVGVRDKYPLLKRTLERFPDHKVMVFTARKHETEELERYLFRDGFSAAYIHGDMYQRDRIKALQSFKEGRVRVFIGTDVASRGLNLNNIDLVVNYHVPHDPEAYIHRIGRTGRAGASGHAIMFVSSEEERQLARIERMHKIQITEVDPEGVVVPRKAPEHRPHGGSGGGGYRGGRGGGYRGNRNGGGGYRGSSSSGGYNSSPRREGGSSEGGYAPRREGGLSYAPRRDDSRGNGGGYAPRPRSADGGRPRSSGGGYNRPPRRDGSSSRYEAN
jgi:superfamily II DNA/RNA helicase